MATSSAPRAQAPVPEQHPYTEGALIYGPDYADAHPRFRKTVPKCKLSDEDARLKVGYKKSLALVEYENTNVYTQYRRLPVIVNNHLPQVLTETDNVAKRCYNARQLPKDHLQSFIKEVKEFGFMSFDTEGQPRVQLIQLGSFRGTCFYFSPNFDENNHENCDYDWSGFAPQLRSLLSDEHIIKVQSDPWRDKDLLAAEGIKVNSVVDTRLLFQYAKEYEEVAPKTKLAVIVKHMLKKTYAKRPHDYIWQAHKLTGAAKKHMCQDVRAPLLFLAALANQFVPAKLNLSPLILHMLMMHLDINEDPVKFVKAENILTGVVVKDPHGPHNIKTVHWLMDTCPYYVSVSEFPNLGNLLPDNGRDYLTSRERERLLEVVQQNWEGHSPASYDYVRVTENPYGWCPYCGFPLSVKDSKGQPIDHSDCMSKHKSCDYPLCTLYEGHSVIFCPILHGICDTCGRRGHQAEIHTRDPEDAIPLLQIEYTTLNWSPLGKLTCVPFMELTPRMEEVSDKHWRYLTTNQKRIASQRMFQILTIPYKAPRCKSRKQRGEIGEKTPKEAQKRKASSSSSSASGFKIPKKTATQSASASQGSLGGSSTDTSTEPVAGPSGLQRKGPKGKGKGKGKTTPVLQSRHTAETRQTHETFVVSGAASERERIMQAELEVLRMENQLLRAAPQQAPLSDAQLLRIKRRALFFRRFMNEVQNNLEESFIDRLITQDMAENPGLYAALPNPITEQEALSVMQLPGPIVPQLAAENPAQASAQTGNPDEYVPPGEEMEVEYNPTPTGSGTEQESVRKQKAPKKKPPNRYCSETSSDESSGEDRHSPKGPAYSPLHAQVSSPRHLELDYEFSTDVRMSPTEDREKNDEAMRAILAMNLNAGPLPAQEKVKGKKGSTTQTRSSKKSEPSKSSDTPTTPSEVLPSMPDITGPPPSSGEQSEERRT